MDKGRPLGGQRNKPVLLIYTAIWAVALVIVMASMFQNIGDARIINYSGIVRGATQKLVKEELNGSPDDALIAELDAILYDLQTGKGAYGLKRSTSRTYQQSLEEMAVTWALIKDQIADVRAGEGRSALFETSELYFDMANRMVRNAERFSSRKLWFAVGFLAAYLFLTVAAFAFFYMRNQRERERSAATDRLTGIRNRTGFEKRAAELLKQYPLIRYTLVKFDIDDFKFVNESYGYAFGDALLKKIAEALEKKYSGSRTCARLSADDFLIMTEHTENVTETLRAVLNEAVDGSVPFDAAALTFSMGVYEQSGDISVKQMLEDANVAHKRAKSGGKSATVLYDETLLEKLRTEKKLTDRLRTALDRREFKLYLQPKFDVASGATVGAEALVRWDHPELGMLSPDRFIPLFEKNGVIAELDYYMLERACEHLRDRLRAGKALPVSVNFSRVTLYRKEFYDKLTATVAAYGVPCALVEIELTESAFNEISESASDMLLRLHEAGFTVSMDDFGAGYSSLNLLNSLPIQIVKLDREFLKDFSHTDRVRGVIACVVQLAHVLGLRVICEGVELAEHLEFLRSVHCEYGQGFYYSRPIPESEFIRQYYSA